MKRSLYVCVSMNSASHVLVCVCVAQYVHYLELQSVDEARAVYKRACEIHLTYKPNIHMQWATFEERHGMRKPKHTALFTFISVHAGLKD